MNLDALYVRDDGTCQLCGDPCDRDEATQDHIFPASEGFDRSDWNVQLAHRACNEAKADTVPRLDGMMIVNQRSYMRLVRKLRRAEEKLRNGNA